MKRIISALCVAALTLTLVHSVTTAMATQNAPPPVDPNAFRVNVEDGTVQFIRNNIVEGAYAAQLPVSLTLHTDKEGELLVLFTQPDGTQKNITLKKQTALALGGAAGKIVLDKSLSPQVSFTLSPAATVDTLEVRSRTSVTLDGNAGTVLVSGAAKVAIAAGSSVGTLRVTSSAASVKVDAKATVQKASSVKPSAISGVKSVARLASSAGSSTSGRSKSSSDSSYSPPPSRPAAPWAPSDPTTPSTPDPDVGIIGIYPSLGKVRVELSRAIALDSSAFYINCPGGKDMTIIKVDTVSGTDKNRIYDLTTAYYVDNTYYMNITLPGGKVLEKKFVTNSLTPEISQGKAERIRADAAKLTFVSDNIGTVYYMAVGGPRSRSSVSATAPGTAQEIKQNGTAASMISGLNSYEISGLTEGAAYTIYMAVADQEGNNLSDIQPRLPVGATVADNPNTGDITIAEADGPDDSSIRIVFSKPTPQKLDISAFYVKCPAQDALHLGRAETSDNQTYMLYLQDGWHYMAKNTYDIKVTFPDGTVATGEFYAETYPAIGIIEPIRTSATTIVVSFHSDKAGWVYCGTTTSRAEKPKLDAVLANGQKKQLFAGNNKLDLSDVPPEHLLFYMVAVDNKGHTPSFVDDASIPAEITPPDTGDGENANTIESITTGTNGSGNTTITITLKNAVNITALSNDEFVFVAREGGAESPPRIVTLVPPGSGIMHKSFTLSLNCKIPSGSRYDITIPLETGNITGSFSVGLSAADAFIMDSSSSEAPPPVSSDVDSSSSEALPPVSSDVDSSSSEALPPVSSDADSSSSEALPPVSSDADSSSSEAAQADPPANQAG